MHDPHVVARQELPERERHRPHEQDDDRRPIDAPTVDCECGVRLRVSLVRDRLHRLPQHPRILARTAAAVRAMPRLRREVDHANPRPPDAKPATNAHHRHMTESPTLTTTSTLLAPAARVEDAVKQYGVGTTAVRALDHVTITID